MKVAAWRSAASAILGLALTTAALAGCVSSGSNDAARTTPSQSATPSAPATVAPDGAARPAPPGTPLAPLTQPPAQSLWALSAESYDKGVSMALEFQPYGIGPSSFGPSIVALVTSARPPQAGARVPDLTGRNVVFILGQTKVESGGCYTGTAVTRMQDDRIVFVLQQVSPANGP